MGFAVVPSEANFVMMVLAGEQEADRVPRVARTRVVVRPLKAFGLPNCLRISTGTDQENQRYVEAVEKAVAARAV